MKLFNTSKINVDEVIHKWINLLGIKVTAQSSTQCVQNHPEYPSLLSISDCLTEWNISYEPKRIVKANYDVNALLFPFLAHLPAKKGRFILVKSITNGLVKFADEKQNNGVIPEAEFLQTWDGIALYAEAHDDSGEKDYQKKYFKGILQQLVIPGLIIIPLCIITFVFSQQPFTLTGLFLTLLKTIGLAVSVLLLIQSINANNPFIQNLCGLAGKNDCNAILKSDAAKVTSWLTWSEVGFFYFAGSLLSLLLVPSSLVLLAWLNLFALPYTIYSISYQYRNKNWCILCCAVQAILILETLAFNLQSITYNFKLLSLNLLPLIFLAPIFTWAFLKPFFLQAAQLKPLKKQVKKFKYNSNLFKQALTNQPCYAIGEELMPIILGNPNATTIITMVSNPFCGPCSKTHQQLDEWLQTRNDLQLKLIFTTAAQDDDKRTQVAKHVTALSLLTDKTQVENALNDWYAQSPKNYETWAAKYPISFNGNLQTAMEAQKQWCDLTEITFTPTILINGYKLPEPYTLEDIKYLMD